LISVTEPSVYASQASRQPPGLDSCISTAAASLFGLREHATAAALGAIRIVTETLAWAR
jgi:hypothetical protein